MCRRLLPTGWTDRARNRWWGGVALGASLFLEHFHHALAILSVGSESVVGQMDQSGIDANESVTHRSSGPMRRIHLQHYALAILSVAVALGASLVLEHFHFRVPSALLVLFAVAISSWYGGLGPAALAVLLSVITFYWYFVQPVHTLTSTGPRSRISSSLQCSLRSCPGSARFGSASRLIFARVATCGESKQSF